MIEKFDAQWSRYEEAYIGELMVIERDARRYLFELAESVQTMDRGAMFKAIGELNSVANTQGQGRKDFTQDLLAACQAICDSQ